MSVDITRLTAHLSPEQQDEVKRAYRRRHENSTAAFLWCFFFGTLGAHRFYLKQWGAGFLRLLVPLIAVAAVVAGIVLKLQPAIVVAIVIVLLLIALLWEIIDLFRIDHEVYARNLKLAESLIAGTLLSDHTVEQQATGRMEGLMLQARDEAASAARAERQEVAADAAAAVPPVAAAIAERSTTSTDDETEATIAAQQQRSEAAAAASDTYVARTVTEISDDPNATQHAVRSPMGPQNDWSATENVHVEGERERTAEDAGTETAREPGALGDAATALGGAAVAGYALDEAITRSHSETDHSTTDSLETHATLSAAEAEQEDEAVAAEVEEAPVPAPIPTLAEAETPTWPDHAPVTFAEPVPGAELEPSDSTFDVTDTTGVMEAVKPVADIEPEAVPLIISLPALAGSAGIFEATTEPGGADEALVELDGPPDETDLFVASAAPASETSDDVPLVLLPVEGLDEPEFGGASVADTPAGAAGMDTDAVPAESYIPPTVPVVTAEPIAETPEAGEPVPFAVEPEAPAGESEAPAGETLAELAAFAGAAGVGGAVAGALTHRGEAAPAAEVAPEQEQMTPAAPEPEAAAEPEPVPVAVPTTTTTPAAPVATEAAAEAAAPVEQPRHRLRRIREYLQIKREGQVVEELVAEELIEVDEDPEPARQRLRDQLHQQAIERGLE